jgi:hypothetical protein
MQMASAAFEEIEYFIRQQSQPDWLMGAYDSRCAEASKTLPRLFM